jgi:hypothetical protein
MGLLSTLSRIANPGPSFELFSDIGFTHTVRPELHIDPFRYILIDNFLPEAQNAALRDHFKRTLDAGMGEDGAHDKFRYRKVYDINLFWPQPSLDAPYSAFYSKSYFEMLRTLFRVPLSNDTIVMYHHHGASNNDDYIHNDFAEGHFMDEPLPNGINPWHFQCTHSAPPESEHTRTMARAMAGLYYLNNEWKPGDGGETAFFRSHNPDSLVRKIEPLNNRLVVFDVTPTSWHNYLKSSAPSRDSVAQWFFIPMDECRKRFPSTPPWKGSVGY